MSYDLLANQSNKYDTDHGVSMSQGGMSLFPKIFYPQVKRYLYVGQRCMYYKNSSGELEKIESLKPN